MKDWGPGDRLQDAFWRRMTPRYGQVLARPDAAYHRSVQLVHVTYAVWTYFALGLLRQAPTWATEPPTDLLWPTAWMASLPWPVAVWLVTSTFLLGSMAATIAPRRSLTRVVAFLGILTAQGLKYSYEGKINHSYHLWVLAALLLVFLPSGRDQDDRYKRSYLEISWGVQATILVTYSLAGMQKVWGAALDLLEDGQTVLSPHSLAWHVAKVELRGTGGGVLGPYVLDSPAIGGPLMAGALVLELLAVTVLFRPRAQRVLAVGFIAMHLGIGMVMDVWFEAQILIVAVWLLGSPFLVGPSPELGSIREVPASGSRDVARATGDDVDTDREGAMPPTPAQTTGGPGT